MNNKHSLNRFYHKWLYTLLFALIIVLLLSIYMAYSEKDKRIDLIKKPESFATLFIGISAFYIGVVQLKNGNDNLKRQLFSEFNRRYDTLNEGLNEIHDEKIKFKKLKAKTKYKETVNDYLNLCSEQFYWYKKGRIEQDVWEYWLAGMKDHFQNEAIKKFTKDEFQNIKREKSYYGFPAYLEHQGIICYCF